jgi:hypothetical protein
MADYRRQKTEVTTSNQDLTQMVGCANPARDGQAHVFFAHAAPGVYCSVCSYKTTCTPYYYFRHLNSDL